MILHHHFARRVCGALLLLVAEPAASIAAPLYDNILNGGGGTSGFEPAAWSALGPLANSFTAESGPGGFVNQVQLLLNTSNADTHGNNLNDNGGFRMFLARDTGGAPDWVLANALAATGIISDRVLSGDQVTGGLFTWSFQSVPLTANARYWLVLEDAAPQLCSPGDCVASTVQWAVAGDASGVGVAGNATADTTGIALNSDAAPPFQMTVPEPHARGVFATALLLMTTVLRLRGRGRRAGNNAARD